MQKFLPLFRKLFIGLTFPGHFPNSISQSLGRLQHSSSTTTRTIRPFWGSRHVLKLNPFPTRFLRNIGHSSVAVGSTMEVENSASPILEETKLKRYTIPSDVPVIAVECVEAFAALSPKEKLYAHYLSQAAWVGGLIVLVQTSPESPAIFCILHDIFKTNGVNGVEGIAKGACDYSEEDWKAFIAYACGVINGYGNYKGYGDTKIIPALSIQKFESLLKNVPFSNSKGLQLWEEIKERVYSLTENDQQLGYWEKGVTTYFSSNCTVEDIKLVGRFLESRKLEAWMTRAFKTFDGDKPCFEIRTASSKLNEGTESAFEFEGAKFTLTRGDYAPLMKLTCEYLEKAKEFSLNAKETDMLTEYINSFTHGSLDAHKEGSRHWVKDQSPVIESYIGFIESYRDPSGSRAEFEGFVAIVNRELSKKFAALVDNAEKILPILPWPIEFERKTFMKPDFTYLDILSFSGSGIPIGINIPNYDEIRQSEGFKNVTLGNRLTASLKDVEVPFFSKDDQDIMKKYFVKSNEFQTGLHELIGHGSGLNFVKKEDGTTNFSSDLKNPLTDDLIEGCYKPGETYNSVFSDLASPYEECRAETIGIFLSLDLEVLKIFGFDETEGRIVRDVNWLNAVYDGIRSLDMYQPETKAWIQAHSYAAFVTLQVLIQTGQGLVTIEEVVGSDGKPDLLASLDLDLIDTVGRKALGDFILKLQVYKSTAAIDSARSMFETYASISDDKKHPWLKWRDIIIDRKLPRKMCVQANTFLSEDGDTVSLKTYEKSAKGIIQAAAERLPEVEIYSALQFCYENDKPFFPQ